MKWYRTLIGIVFVGFGLPMFADKMLIETDISNGCEVTATLVPGTVANYSLQAIANTEEGYEFVCWTDGETANPRTITHTGDDLIYRAVFAKSSDIHTTNGEVSITIQNAQTPSFWLQAVPQECGTFVKWANGKTSNPLLYVQSDGRVTPTFVLGRPDAMFTEEDFSAGGTVGVHEIPNTCADYSFTAIPTEGYEFLYWMDGSTDNPRVITYGGGDVTMRAVFAKSDDIHLAGGNVSIAVINQITCEYQLTANAGSCSSFQRWSDNGIVNPHNYLETDGTLIPVFSNKEMLKQNDDCEGGTIQMTPVTCGFVLEAIPAKNYRFLEWEDGQTTISRTVEYLEKEYVATFAKGAASRGNIVYPTIQAALNAEGDNVVEILDDVPEDIIVSNTVTIVGDNHHIGNLTILNGGDVTLSNGLVIDNLFLNATTGSSSQLRNEEYLTYANAYVDITLEASKSVASPDLWYAFAVPFEVKIPSSINPTTDVTRAYAPFVATTNSTDYLIWEYDGNLRASSKTNGWVQLSEGELKPGRFYMIGVDGNANIWRFKKKEGSALGGEKSVALYAYESDEANSGWNAMANSALTYATASTANNVQIAQVYANGASTARYDVCHFSETEFVMACPFFIQTAGNDNLILTSTQPIEILSVPRRTVTEPSYYKVQLVQKGEVKDALFLFASDDALDTYERGKDVIKMLGGNTNPYLYSTSYGYDLCAEYAPINDGVAEYNLNIYTPTAGEYELHLNQVNPEVTLWNNGIQVWNFIAGNYIFDLSRGVNSDYILKIGLDNNNIPTSNDVTKRKIDIFKFIQDERFFIKNRNHVYDVFGEICF